MKTFKLERIKRSTCSPPPGFEPRVPVPSQSGSSATAAFDDGLDSRDVFQGIPRCHCYVHPEKKDVIRVFQRAGWIPKNTRSNLRHEPRNGFIGCKNCHLRFDNYDFFIRYHQESDKYFVVNWSDKKALKNLHGKAVALDPEHRIAVLPSLFLAHEERTRSFHLHTQDSDMAPIPLPIQYQDWIVKDQLLDETGRLQQLVPQSKPELGPQRPQPNKRKRRQGDNGGGGAKQSKLKGTQRSSQNRSASHLVLSPPDIDATAKATRQLPSYKSFLVEGMNWGGTAEQNITQYLSEVGVSES
ncbi:hypothetical protein BT96DRAFT_920221 [Gymnopus androsaceus JB14]|uniref:HNH nuclease domain-containing protein n=1 Tax=Gymnopus androsaceus JB14 TaxID=1447944 RepID=A0A6A4HML9_9AGAR|nr:hypothetical protein BT96DRAFT_920221 [Gymnopus androsaceus JB14]